MLDAAAARALEHNLSQLPYIRDCIADIQGKSEVLAITLQDISYTVSEMHAAMKFQVFFLGVIAVTLALIGALIGTNFIEGAR